MDDRTAPEPDWTRRRLLAGAALVGLGVLGADGAPARPALDPAETDAIAARLAAARLPNPGVIETDHYFALGDAPDDFRDGALEVCEGLARTFQRHLTTKGIATALPAKKMAVVVLAGRKSYEAFKGEEAGGAEGGLFDLDANRLVIFQTNNRLVNTFTLVHEATHQLTYNTGLLSRRGDVPVALSEGLATYGEVWRKDRPSLERPNGPRLGVLKKTGGKGPKWIPMAKLLTDDDLFFDEKTEQVAYAESCLWIYDLLQTAAGAKSLRGYLAAVRKRDDPGHRVEDAETAFGDLVRLDAALKSAARKIR